MDPCSIPKCRMLLPNPKGPKFVAFLRGRRFKVQQFVHQFGANVPAFPRRYISKNFTHMAGPWIFVGFISDSLECVSYQGIHGTFASCSSDRSARDKFLVFLLLGMSLFPLHSWGIVSQGIELMVDSSFLPPLEKCATSFWLVCFLWKICCH